MGAVANVSIDQIVGIMKDKGYRVFEEHDFDMNLVGIRKNGFTNKFDEDLFLFYKNKGNWVSKRYDITTEPGHYWFYDQRRIVNAIAEGQHKGLYALATKDLDAKYNVVRTNVRMHTTSKGIGYPALRQSNKVDVYQVNTKDLKLPANIFPKLNVGPMSGLNVHGTWGKSIQPQTLVDKWSLGCQVFKNHVYSEVYLDFLRTMALQLPLFGNSFTYTLLNVEDFAKILR